MFQHTAARRRLLKLAGEMSQARNVSTHSRPKAAAIIGYATLGGRLVSTHSRPKAAAQVIKKYRNHYDVSTHSRPKAAAFGDCDQAKAYQVSTHSRPKAAALPLFFSPMLVGCFNTQPPEGGCSSFCTEVVKFALFQHTAARRRLHWLHGLADAWTCSFNTQPPEGGCSRWVTA